MKQGGSLPDRLNDKSRQPRLLFVPRGRGRMNFSPVCTAIWPWAVLGFRPVSLSLVTLPIVEKWTCHNCSICCRGTTFLLSDDDLQQLRQQRWEEHPDFRGTRILVRVGLLGRRYRLNKRSDGSCIFLMDDGLCRIHKDYGEPAKPLVCRMFPYQLVPMDRTAVVTLRRYCPSVATDRGQPLVEQMATVRALAEQGHLAQQPTRPPPVVRGVPPSWDAFHMAAAAIERMMLDQRVPHVRRLVQTLEFCHLLGQCRLRRLTKGAFGELLPLLEKSAWAEAGRLFEFRRPPKRLAAMVFRQVALEYLRLHPRLHLKQSWAARWTMIRMAMGFARGKGSVPGIAPHFAPATFEALEEPLGHLAPDVLEPLNRYFETAAASRHYALLLRRGWPLIESFQALALTHPVALWLIRLGATGRDVQISDTVDAVGALDRGQGDPTLAGWRHRRRVASLVRLDELSRLIAWYAR